MNRRALAILCACLMAAATASAHHGVAAYDMEKQVALTGTVKEWRWTSPHTALSLNVPNADGAVDVWNIEGAPLPFLERNGWSKDTLQTGEKISIKMHPLKQGRGGVLAEVTKSNGDVLVIRRPRFVAGR